MTDADRPTLEELGVSAALREKLSAAGYVIVPREPTEQMIAEAWAPAQNESAAGVWETMIEVALSLH